MPDLTQLTLAVGDQGHVKPLDQDEPKMDGGACPTVEQRAVATSQTRCEQDDLDSQERWLDEGGR